MCAISVKSIPVKTQQKLSLSSARFLVFAPRGSAIGESEVFCLFEGEGREEGEGLEYLQWRTIWLVWPLIAWITPTSLCESFSRAPRSQIWHAAQKCGATTPIFSCRCSSSLVRSGLGWLKSSITLMAPSDIHVLMFVCQCSWVFQACQWAMAEG